MNKIAITYIGPKAVKKDTVTNSRLVFPKGKSVSVESDIAHQLLDYPKVWALSDEAEDIVKEQEEKAKAVAEKIALEKKAEQEKNLDQSMLVNVNGETIDIGKYSGNQLVTLVAASDLVISVKPKPVPQYREAIRDELRKLNGTPELEGQE
jgi:hypothetical protein